MNVITVCVQERYEMWVIMSDCVLLRFSHFVSYILRNSHFFCQFDSLVPFQTCSFLCAVFFFPVCSHLNFPINHQSVQYRNLVLGFFFFFKVIFGVVFPFKCYQNLFTSLYYVKLLFILVCLFNFCILISYILYIQYETCI